MLHFDGQTLSYRYRLLPTRRQHAALAAILESQRQFYNAALDERIACYRRTGKSRTYIDQTKALTECRRELSEMAALPAQLQRATLHRLDQAYMQRTNGGSTAAATLTLKGEPRKRFMFTHQQVIALTRELSKHGAVDEEKSLYTYQPGHGDETICKAVTPELPVEKVAEFRREHFGRLASEIKPTKEGGPAKTAALQAKVEEHEAKIAELEARLAKVEVIAKELGS